MGFGVLDSVLIPCPATQIFVIRIKRSTLIQKVIIVETGWQKTNPRAVKDCVVQPFGSHNHEPTKSPLYPQNR